MFWYEKFHGGVDQEYQWDWSLIHDRYAALCNNEVERSPKKSSSVVKKRPVNTPFRVMGKEENASENKKQRVHEMMTSNGNVFNHCVFNF